MRRHAITVAVVIFLGFFLFAGLSAQDAAPDGPSDGVAQWRHLAMQTYAAAAGHMKMPLAYLPIEYARFTSGYFPSSILAVSVFRALTDSRAALSPSASSGWEP